ALRIFNSLRTMSASVIASAANGSQSSIDWSRLLPYSFKGTVVHGFGRGGKQLDCPTANMDEAAVTDLPMGLIEGVYWGTGRVIRAGGVTTEETGIVMSIGFNPHFGNEKKTLEVHFLAKMDDFYGSQVEGTIRGFMRDMPPFKSMGTKWESTVVRGTNRRPYSRFALVTDALVEQIRKDKEEAARMVERERKNKM
ncbi:hypothetical protein PMAYCL1PPCAC_21006, partial [Pristionchus mayeri]